MQHYCRFYSFLESLQPNSSLTLGPVVYDGHTWSLIAMHSELVNNYLILLILLLVNEIPRQHLVDLDAKKPVIVCGDLNVAHKVKQKAVFYI